MPYGPSPARIRAQRRIRFGGGASLLVAVTFLGWTPTGAQAQEPRADGRETPAAVGDYVLSFELPEGGGPGFGMGFQTSTRTRLGFFLRGQWNRSDYEDTTTGAEGTSRSWSVEGGPELRVYGLQARRVLPFLHLAAAGGYGEAPDESTQTLVRGEVGFGAEWFPVRSVGISGQTGLGIRRTRAEPGTSGPTTTGLSAELFRSGLSLNLYF
jgi:hypothetical protein